MTDITMSVDDTLELDALIQEWSSPESIINVTDGTEGTDFDLDGIQTNTGIFNPTNAGTYNIKVNGQKLTVEVTESSTIPNPIVTFYKYEDNDDTSTAVDSQGNTNAIINGSSYTSSTVKVGSYGLDHNRSNGDYTQADTSVDLADKGDDSSMGFGGWMDLSA